MVGSIILMLVLALAALAPSSAFQRFSSSRSQLRAGTTVVLHTSDNEEEDADENEESDDINSDKGEEQSVSQNTPWKHSELSMLIADLKRIKRL